ncbi:MAG: DUF1592 domain-containing protein, partial [Myxococcales bacterium]|nr:DUF1592 domain-containing protein [Myxococcales bacterium]
METQPGIPFMSRLAVAVCLSTSVLGACWADIEPAAVSGTTIVGAPDEEAPDDAYPGAVTIHRLNRTEYNNTVQDLLGTTLAPADDFPADDTGYGFDNVADVLAISPLHLELYEHAAQALVDELLFVADPLSERFEAESSPADVGGVTGDGQGWILWSNGGLGRTFSTSVAGTYQLSAMAFGQQAGDEPAGMAFVLDGIQITTFAVEAVEGAAQRYDTEAVIQPGDHEFRVEFTNDYWVENEADRNLVVDWFSVAGPNDVDLSNPRRQELVQCEPSIGSEPECIQSILADFLPRAWRRPVTDDEIDRLMTLAEASIDEGDSFDDALGTVLVASLLSPNFLFRLEEDVDPTSDDARLLNDYEIASRLSYFLWSTMPDDELFQAAAEGELQSIDGIEAQVRRMINDDRAYALVENFAGQWLYIRDIDNVFPDVWIFPDFDESLRSAMREEMERFAWALINEDRSMTELLVSQTGFINARLADHYGLPFDGSDFQEVDLTDTNRGGVLTQAGLLTVLSTPTRTSVVRRGKW